MGVPHPRSRQGGYPIQLMGVPHLRSRWGGVPHPADLGEYPIPGPGRGVSHPRSRWGVPHPAYRGVPCPRSRGYPIPDLGGEWYSIQLTRGAPSQVQVGYPPHPDLGWGTLLPVQGWMVLPTHPPIQDWMEYPPPPPIRRQSSIASTCYVAGGMPLAFTQEDLLVFSVSTTPDALIQIKPVT